MSRRAGAVPGILRYLAADLTNHDWRSQLRSDLEGSRIAPHQARRWAFDIEPLTTAYYTEEVVSRKRKTPAQAPIGGCDYKQTQPVGTGKEGPECTSPHVAATGMQERTAMGMHWFTVVEAGGPLHGSTALADNVV